MLQRKRFAEQTQTHLLYVYREQLKKNNWKFSSHRVGVKEVQFSYCVFLICANLTKSFPQKIVFGVIERKLNDFERTFPITKGD